MGERRVVAIEEMTWMSMRAEESERFVQQCFSDEGLALTAVMSGSMKTSMFSERLLHSELGEEG